MATPKLLSDRARRVIISFVSSRERLDVLLYLHELRGRSVSAELVARACGISVGSAEWHLSYLASCGFLGATIGSEPVYAFRPLTETMRVVVEELHTLNVHRRPELLDAIRALQPLRALVADDDADMRDILQTALEGRGFRVVTVASGKEGLTRCAGENFTLAIVDLRASRSNGLALLQALRARDLDLPLIVTTAVRDARLDAEIAGLGIADVLEKPFDLEDLDALIERCRRGQDCRAPLQPV